jgi:hypothetical protein
MQRAVIRSFAGTFLVAVWLIVPAIHASASTASIDSPSNGDTVASTFDVSGSISPDVVGEAWSLTVCNSNINNTYTIATTADPTPFDLTVTPGVKGACSIELRDPLNNLAASIMVQVSPPCKVTVPSGGDIQSALAANPGGVVCLQPGGSYSPAGSLKPSASTTLLTPSNSVATIHCASGKTVDCIYARTVSGITVEDVDIESPSPPGRDGINAGPGATIGPNVRISGAGRMGVMISTVANVTLFDSTLVNNATNCSAYGGLGYCSSVKGNTANGVQIFGNTITGSPSKGVWLDINTKNWLVSNNILTNNVDGGIRIEISCFGTVSGNTLTGSSNALRLVNSNNVSIDSNTVAGGATGIAFFANGRTTGASGAGDGSCASQNPGSPQPAGTYYYNFANAATNNGVSTTSKTLDGFWTQRTKVAGLTFGDSFQGTNYTGGQCGTTHWQYWDTSLSDLTFAGWQGKAEDTSGSCA